MSIYDFEKSDSIIVLHTNLSGNSYEIGDKNYENHDGMVSFHLEGHSTSELEISLAETNENQSQSEVGTIFDLPEIFDIQITESEGSGEANDENLPCSLSQYDCWHNENWYNDRESDLVIPPGNVVLVDLPEILARRIIIEGTVLTCSFKTEFRKTIFKGRFYFLNQHQMFVFLLKT